MKPKTLTVTLTVLNLILAGLAAYLYVLLQQRGEPARLPGRGPQVVANTVTQLLVKKISPTNRLTLFDTFSLRWSHIESTNYFQYIANLRAIGCPEETIRDIIITDVAKLYVARMNALLDEAPPYEYWRPEEPWREPPAAEKAWRDKVRALQQEERDLIHELLGVDLDTELAHYSMGDIEVARQLTFLPADKRQQVWLLERRYQRLEAQLAQSGASPSERAAAQAELEKQRQADLKKLLSPEELTEYALRRSPTAAFLRRELSGFNPTEAEFRRIFELQQTIDKQFAQTTEAGDESMGLTNELLREQAEAAMEEELKKTLGEERYAEYLRARDQDYKTLIQLTDRYGLPRDTANRIYEMKLQAERQKQRVESNPNLTYDQRVRALEAIARETVRAIGAELGGLDSDVWKAYQQQGGLWIASLTETSTPPPPPTPVAPPAPPGPVEPEPPPGAPHFAPIGPVPPVPPLPPGVRRR